MLPDDKSLPSTEDWPEFHTLLDKIYPSGFPTLAGAGSLRNYFENLPRSAQMEVLDEEMISLLEFML